MLKPTSGHEATGRFVRFATHPLLPLVYLMSLCLYIAVLAYGTKSLPILNALAPRWRLIASVAIAMIIVMCLARLVAYTWEAARIRGGFGRWVIWAFLALLLFTCSALAILTVLVEQSEGREVHSEALLKVKKQILDLGALAQNRQPPAPEFDMRSAELKRRWERMEGEALNRRLPLCGIGPNTLTELRDIERTVLMGEPVLLSHERKSQPGDLRPCDMLDKDPSYLPRIQKTFARWRGIAENILINLPVSQKESAGEKLALRQAVLSFSGTETMARLEGLGAELQQRKWEAEKRALETAIALDQQYNSLWGRMKAAGAQGIESLPPSIDLAQLLGVGRSTETLGILWERADRNPWLLIWAILLIGADFLLVGLTQLMRVRYRLVSQTADFWRNRDERGHLLVDGLRYLWIPAGHRQTVNLGTS